jgi:hypothetical protein
LAGFILRVFFCARFSVGTTFTVTFLEWPRGAPPDNNLYSHDGAPPLGFFKCAAAAVTGATEPTCRVDDYGETDARFLKEYKSCSNHGECNPVSRPAGVLSTPKLF